MYTRPRNNENGSIQSFPENLCPYGSRLRRIEIGIGGAFQLRYLVPSPLPGERGRVRANLDCIVGADVSVGPDS